MKKLLSLFAFLLVSNATWAADNQPKRPEYRLALEGEYEPAKSAVNQTRCTICLQDFCDKDKRMKYLPCDPRHNKYHEDCIEEWLAQNNNCPMCKKNFGPAQPSPGLTLLDAVIANNLEAVQALINSGATLNIHDESGITPLMLAIIISQPNIIQALIDGGANLNLQENVGHTALMLAVMSSQPRDIIQALIDGGTNLDLTDNWGNTALMLAIAKKNVPAVQLLFNKTKNYDETTRQQALDLLKENVREADV